MAMAESLPPPPPAPAPSDGSSATTTTNTTSPPVRSITFILPEIPVEETSTTAENDIENAADISHDVNCHSAGS